MMTSLRSLFAPVALLATAMSCSAQFSYDFNGDTADIFTYSTFGNGLLTPPPALNFFHTDGVSVGDDDATLVYRHYAQLDADWSASFTVLMPFDVTGSTLPLGAEVEIGLSLFLPGGGDTGNDIDLRLAVSNPSGTEERFFFSEYSDRNDISTVADVSTTATVAILSFDYDFATGILTAAYDGNTLSSHDLFHATTGWDVTTASLIGIALNVGSEGIDFLNSSAPGLITFTTSVVPEPTTYAWTFGTMTLGIALWRRRTPAA